MPNRIVCVAILLFWTVAAGWLVRRDVLPTILMGAPPDLRTISQSDAPEGPVRWSILAVDDQKKGSLRSVGQLTTETKRKRDGWVRYTSQAWLDSAELFRGTKLGMESNERIGVVGSAEVDSTGNLQSFRVSVHLNERGGEELLSLDGHLKKDMLEINTRTPLSFLSGTQYLPYRPRGIVQNSLGPLDRMPGLQVGQTWETQVVSPITGAIQSCQVEVVSTEHIIWDNAPIMTMKVVTRMMPISVTTWVRPDGLVLRQEVPVPNRVKLIMERRPDAGEDRPSAPENRRR